MSVLGTDFVLFPAATVSDDPATNGGRPATAPVSLNSKNNIFPDIGSAAMTAGKQLWRKIFLANLNAENLAATSPIVVQDKPTIYDDYAYFIPADFDGTENGISSNPNIYSCALLSTNANTGADTLTVALENAALAPAFAVGRKILISSRSAFENTASTAGTEERATIKSVSASGLVLTITLNTPLQNAYTVAAGSRASVIYEPPTIAPTLTDWQESGAGSFDAANHPVRLTNLGAIRQKWTIDYTSATAFTLTGDALGLIGTFETSADVAPGNPASYANGAAYLIIPKDGHGASHQAGDRITFATSPAACALWVRRTVLPATTEIGPSDIAISILAESES